MLFPFTQISNDYCQKFYNGFSGFLVFSTSWQIFNDGTFKFFWNLQGYAFCFFIFFQNEWNITTSLFVIHLKCTAVHYAKLNSSSKNKPFLNYELLNMLFHFFIFILIKLLWKNLWNNYRFLIQIYKIHFKI